MIRKERKVLFRILSNPMTLTVLGFIIIIVLSIPAAKNASKRYAINKEIKELEKEIESMEKRSAKLNGLIDCLSSNQYLEEQARLNFGLKNKGEETAVIESSENGTTTKGADDFMDTASKEFFNIPGIGEEPPAKPLSNPQRWRRYFFKN